jgi:hypothetical protein
MTERPIIRRRDLTALLLASAAEGSFAGDGAGAPAGRRGGPRHPITFAEESAGATPLNYDVPPPYPERYGAVGDGMVNDQEALSRCLAANDRIFLTCGKTYLINGLTISRANVLIQGAGGAGLVIADGADNFGLRFVHPSGNRTHFDTGFVARDLIITCRPGASRITGVSADNAEIVLLDNVVVSLVANTYKGSSVGDGSIAFYGFFQQDGVFIKCAFSGGRGAYGDGVHLTGSLAANETPNNNYFMGCRAQSCGGHGVRIRLGDGNIWRGGKIQANFGGGWIEGDDGLGHGPSNTVIADMGFEANHGSDLTLGICGRIRVHDCTFQSTGADYHIHETGYAARGYFQRNMSFAGKPVRFAGTGTDNVWDYNNGFGAITANEKTFSIDSDQVVALAYGPSISTDCSKGYHFVVAATDAKDFVILNPTNPKQGQLYTWEIDNDSGAALGAVGFGSEFSTQGTFTPPANAKRRTITFRRIRGRYIEIARNTLDVS